MNSDDVRGEADKLLGRRAINQRGAEMLHEAANLIDAGGVDRDLADELLVFASWYGSAKTRQLTRELFATLLAWHSSLKPDDDFVAPS